MFGDFVHPFLAHAIFATDTIIAPPSRQIRRFLKGWFETIAFSKTHKDRGDPLFATSHASLRAETPRRSISTRRRCSRPTAASISTAVEVVKKSLIDMGQAKTRCRRTIKLFTEEFLPQKP